MTEIYDVIIIGGGIAGASIGAALAPKCRVMILEREGQPGYHSTGRSAAVLVESYGSAPVRALTRASRSFYAAPPAGFTDYPLLRQRAVLYIARSDQEARLAELADRRDMEGATLIGGEAALSHCPILQPGLIVAALHEPSCMDLDVHEIHSGFLRMYRAAKGRIQLDCEVMQITGGYFDWTVRTPDGEFNAPIIVNAAGAWADEMAELAGIASVGLEPRLRTALTIAAPEGVDIDEWPMVLDVDEEFYFKPDAGRLLLSPADEALSPPGDAQPAEYDVALAVHRFEQATTISVTQVLSRWAGLRNFVADRTPLVGFDSEASGFFWLAAQGGYGIQTAPAIAQVAAAQILGRSAPSWVEDAGVKPVDLSPSRIRDLRDRSPGISLRLFEEPMEHSEGQ